MYGVSAVPLVNKGVSHFIDAYMLLRAIGVPWQVQGVRPKDPIRPVG